MRFMFFLVFSFYFIALNAQLGLSIQAVEVDRSLQTIAVSSADGNIYTFEPDGFFYVTNTKNGFRKLIDNLEFQNTKFIFSDNQTILSIDKGGSLYTINPNAGTKVQLGLSGSWSGAVAGTFLNGKLYILENSGALNLIDIAASNWTQLGNVNYENVIGMWSSHDKLYTIDDQGTLCAVNPRNGSWEPVGNELVWSKTISGTVIGDFLYTLDSEGRVYGTNLLTGEWNGIMNNIPSNINALITQNNKVIAVLKDGSLQEIAGE